MKVRTAVADAGPLHYFALLGYFELIAEIIEHVIVPDAVRSELLHPNTPEPVRLCIRRSYRWLTFSARPANTANELAHAGELETIEVAKKLPTKAVLMDDAFARKLAIKEGLIPIGTIGMLEMVSKLGLIDLNDAFVRLQNTNAFINPALLAEALVRDLRRKQ